MLLLRRLWLPLPPSCVPAGVAVLDVLGHHRAGYAEAGVLGRRGFALESAAAHVSQQPEKLQTCTFERPAFKNTTKIQREGTPSKPRMYLSLGLLCFPLSSPPFFSFCSLLFFCSSFLQFCLFSLLLSSAPSPGPPSGKTAPQQPDGKNKHIKHHQKSMRRPPERARKERHEIPEKKRMKMEVGERKKRAKFWVVWRKAVRGRSGKGRSEAGPLAKIGLVPPKSAQIGQVKGCGQSPPGRGQK